MLLSTLLKNINVLNSYQDIEVTGISYKMDQDVKNSIFVCLCGVNVDGHIFAHQALEKGAKAILCERDIGLNNQIIVEDTRASLAKMANAYFEFPTDQLSLIAVTGTNGKTSVATMVNYVLNNIGHKSGLFSTIKIEYGENIIEPITTTPGPYYLMQMLRKMLDTGCEFAVMEASSHALEQRRLCECFYDVAIFTNLTQDHLDYHKTMENYYLAKRKLFEIAKFGIINIDDEYGVRLTKEISIPYYTYSTVSSDADFFASNIQCNSNGVNFTLTFANIHVKVKIPIPGIYSVQNALAVIATCVSLGASLESVSQCLDNFKGIDGRCEVITTNTEFTVICDYAHTPDGIENILTSIRNYTKGRLISVFGCGGDRDKTKRPLMASAVTSLSDITIITSDNPRTEQPEDIIRDIEKGVLVNSNYVTVVNRKDAIEYSLDIARKDDVVVLLGKGHERYQIIGKSKLSFDEREVVKEYLNKKTLEDLDEQTNVRTN